LARLSKGSKKLVLIEDSRAACETCLKQRCKLGATVAQMSDSELLKNLSEIAKLPMERAVAMQPGMYQSPGILKLEEENIFSKEWICVGRALDVPKHGDFITSKVGDQPVVTIRGADGAIRSFANICLHRMMQIVSGKGSTRSLVCPYHAWTYNSEGCLIAAPRMEKTVDFDIGSQQLPSVRTEVWHGFIYVTMDSHAHPLADRLEPLGALLAKYRLQDYVPLATEDYLWDTNWKLLTENFMESYHLPVAHRATIGQWLPVESSTFDEKVFDAFTYQAFTKNEDAQYGRAHPDNTRLEGRWRYTTIMPTVFPSHMFVAAPDHAFYMALQPQGTSQVHIRFGVMVAPEALARQTDREAYIRDTIAFFGRVNEEDKYVVEGICKGAKAPLSRPGRLSWMEREIHDFIGYLARKLTPSKIAKVA
jgi:phenylpropionate dioxygenase-like ring-hydroxylating dioxygenase large terminal subunit